MRISAVGPAITHPVHQINISSIGLESHILYIKSTSLPLDWNHTSCTSNQHLFHWIGITHPVHPINISSIGLESHILYIKSTSLPLDWNHTSCTSNQHLFHWTGITHPVHQINISSIGLESHILYIKSTSSIGLLTLPQVTLRILCLQPFHGNGWNLLAF